MENFQRIYPCVCGKCGTIHISSTLFAQLPPRQTDNASYGPAGFIDSEDSSGCIKHGEWRSIVTSRDSLVPLPRPNNTGVPNSGKDIREGLKDYLNGVGAVTWQLNHVRRTDNM